MIWLTAILIFTTITSAIKVPTAWSDQEFVKNGLSNKKPQVPLQLDKPNIVNYTKSPYSQAYIHNKPYYYARTPDVHNPREINPEIKRYPVVPQFNTKNRNTSNNKVYANYRHNNLQNSLPKTHIHSIDWIPIINKKNPAESSTFKNKYVNGIVRNPDNDHEIPKKIPTRVNYPGVGKWAIRGVKHKPYLLTPKYTTVADEGIRPKGFEIFKRVNPILDLQKQKFTKTFATGKKDRQIDLEQQSEDGEDDGFVPTQQLTQVRRSDSEEYLPTEQEDPRLREVIKDSKVHIVYTEEGYEDIGYDHAGEERSAEENEGQSVHSEGSLKKNKVPSTPIDVIKQFENYEDVIKRDNEHSGSNLQLIYQKPTKEEFDSSVTNNSKRTKRFVNDIPDIQIEEYLTEKEESLTVHPQSKSNKYPYYSIKYEELVPKQSALRYSEDINNIPQKIGGELSFYKHSGAANCPEILHNVNPIPTDLDTKKSNNNSEPRLNKLGDKIACLKLKYFGANPLDSPIFTEPEIEEPELNFKAFFQNLASNKRSVRSLDEDSQVENQHNDLEEPLPEQAALRVHIIRRKFRLPPPRARFGASSYLPTSSPPFPPHSTVLPKYKTISEVYYKDDIQPNEQLNVFADVMNNIKKIRTDLVSADSEIIEDTLSQEPEVQKTGVKIKVPSKKIKIRQTSTPSYRTSRTTTTTEKSYTVPSRKNKYKNHKPDTQLYEEYINTIKQNEPGQVTSKKNNKETKDVNNYIFTESDQDEEVIGLSPPIASVIQFTTPGIFEKTPRDQGLNTYHVAGMNPPTLHQPIPYSSFISKTTQLNRVRRKNQHHRILKRSANRSVYSEIKREKPDLKAQEEDDDDDYIPQRNRNFRYDPGKRRVIYNQPPEEVEEEEEQEEELEIPSTTFPTTTTESGPSFLDYVSQLKSHGDYKFIMEPTKKTMDEENVQTMTTPPTPLISTVVPDFLNIVGNLRRSEGYVAIPEKTIKLTTSATTDLPSNDNDSIDDEDEKSLQFKDIDIFDISEYIPKQETYTPKIVIDYSKYKTIERRPIHNISSRYNVEEDNISLSNIDKDVFFEESTTQEVFSSSTTEATTTKKVRLQTRRRPIRTTTKPTSAPTTTSSPTTTPRARRRFRSTTVSTTTQVLHETETQSRRVVSKKLPSSNMRQQVPPNHKEVYTPIGALEDVQRVELELLSNIKVAKLIAPKKINDAEVLNGYNLNRKHGGNYARSAKNTAISTTEDEEVERLTDVVPKPFAFYSDPTLPQSVNHLKENTQQKIDGNKENEYKDEIKIIEERDGMKIEKDSVFIIKDPSKRLYFYAPVKR